MYRRLRARRWRSALALIAIGSVLGVIVATSSPGSAPSATASAPLGASPSIGVGGLGGTASPTSSTGAARSPRPTVGPTRSTATPSPRPTSTSGALGHVWWIILENHEYGAIIGSGQAPYLNALAAQYGLATNYYATSHPSEPNYVALVAGSTLGVSSDGVYDLTGPSLFSQLAAAGRTWRVYAQDDQAGCFTGTSADGGPDGPGAPGTYARKHNPAISFTSVAGNPAQCRNIGPLGAFAPGAASFELIIPNLTNDMHDGSIGQGDAFLAAFVPQIIASPAFRAGGVLFITFDEGGSNGGSLGDGGGHVATLIISPDVTAGYRYRAYADHASLLRTTEGILGLPCLANACGRSPIIY